MLNFPFLAMLEYWAGNLSGQTHPYEGPSSHHGNLRGGVPQCHSPTPWKVIASMGPVADRLGSPTRRIVFFHPKKRGDHPQVLCISFMGYMYDIIDLCSDSRPACNMNYRKQTKIKANTQAPDGSYGYQRALVKFRWNFVGTQWSHQSREEVLTSHKAACLYIGGIYEWVISQWQFLPYSWHTGKLGIWLEEWVQSPKGGPFSASYDCWKEHTHHLPSNKKAQKQQERFLSKQVFRADIRH